MRDLARKFYKAGDTKGLLEIIHSFPRDRYQRNKDGWWGTTYRLLMNIAPVYDRELRADKTSLAQRIAGEWKKHELTENVIFLDIDGVLQGDWIWPSVGFYPVNCHRFLWRPVESVEKFDQPFLHFLRGLCEIQNISIVLVSTWRGILRGDYLDMFAHYLQLPIAGATGHADEREVEIYEFMQKNLIIERSVTLDDELYDVGALLNKHPILNRFCSVMENTHIRIDNIEGPMVSQMREVAKLFGTTFDDVCRHNRIKRKEKEL